MNRSYVARNAVGAIVASLFYVFVCYWFSISYVLLSATDAYVGGAGETGPTIVTSILVFAVTHLSCFLIGFLICKRHSAAQTLPTVQKNGPNTQSAPPAGQIHVAVASKSRKGQRIGLVFSGIFVLIVAAVAFLQISTVGGLITPYYICSVFLAVAFLLTGFGLFNRP